MAKLDLAHYQNRHSFRSRILRIAWSFIWALFCRWTPQGLGLFYAWRNLWLRLFGAKIGCGCHIYPDVSVWQPWCLEMGDDSCLSNGVKCYSVDKIVIGNNVVISEDAFLCTASHDISSKTFELTTAPIAIKDQSWVCSRSIILPGITIGEGAVVGAGSVVTKDVAPWTVVAGNPARFIKKRELKND